MTEKAVLETTNIEEGYTLNVTPEYISSLSGDERKALRSYLYQYPDEGLEYESLERLKSLHPFNLDTSSIIGKKKSYKGDFVLNEEELKKLDLQTGIDIERLREVIAPKSNISYVEAESLFNGDIELLLTSMSLMSNSYLSIFSDIDSRVSYSIETNNLHPFKTPFLFTNSEEVIFFTGRTLLKELNKEKGDEYINQIIDDIDSIIFRFNTGLIGDVIRKYVKEIDEEYFSVGTVGLVKTIKEFDIDKGHKFSTYATYWIRREIIVYYYDKKPYIRIPRYLHKTLKDLNKAKEILKKQNGGKSPSLEEAASYCRERDDSFAKSDENLKMALKSFNLVLSLDKEKQGDSEEQSTLYDYIENENESIDDYIDLIEIVDRLRRLIDESNLDDRSIEVLNRRYGFLLDWENTSKSYYTLEEIGAYLGVTRERARQIEVNALEKLKNTDTLEN